MLTKEEALRLFYVMEIGALFTNWLSIFAAVFVVLVIAGAMVIDNKSMNRVSIRITLAISILDVIKSILTLLFFQALDISEMECVFVESLENFVTLAYFFLNVSIAANLHLIFLNGFGFDPLWERGYWIGSFGLAMLLSSVVPGTLKGDLL
ncbi:hypothetical protein DSO57_1035329 [Entomophthora muscae]|uniref:Uncharacterized protein n=1 Tax=Entomophthora muscae TaxID=34485 RepID=A0ACC2UAD4_9FUNG|nr:hypothetical protein DSO57_1035329 [Entomophthora muscae]